MATFKQRCSTSGIYYLNGLYPLSKVNFAPKEVNYLSLPNSPLVDTPYLYILQKIEDESKMCLNGPVVEIPHNADIMFHTRNCKTLHEYLNKDKYDIYLLDTMLHEYFTPEVVKECKAHLEEHYNATIKNLRDYFTLIDARVAEKYQLQHEDIRTY